MKRILVLLFIIIFLQAGQVYAKENGVMDKVNDRQKVETDSTNIEIPPPIPVKRPFKVVTRFNVDKPFLALTFDDGGSQRNVRDILDVLSEYGIPGTFFLNGEWVDANPELLLRMVREGHEIANHTYSHARLTYLGLDEIEAEIMDTENSIIKITGKGTNYFRPPYGAYNEKVKEVVEGLGFQALVMWSVDTRDWNGGTADAIIQEVLDNAGSGSIVLFHLHGANTAEALRTIIPELQNAGYRLTTINGLQQMEKG